MPIRLLSWLMTRSLTQYVTSEVCPAPHIFLDMLDAPCYGRSDNGA